MLAGLGFAALNGDPIVAPDGSLWQWVKLDYGQDVLVKRREELPRLPAFVAPQPRLVPAEDQADVAAETLLVQEPLTHEPSPKPASSPAVGSKARSAPRAVYPDDVEEGVAMFVKSRFDLILMSRLFVHYARSEHGVTKAALFGGLAAEAIRRADDSPRRSS
jgi:hypothetical protein